MQLNFFRNLEQARKILKNGESGGVLRLYVDGTNGDDGHYGWGGWDQAWKTLSSAIDRMKAIDTALSFSLTKLAFLRGSFATEDLNALLWSAGLGHWHIGQHVDDMTTVRTAVVSAVTAATEKHSLARITLAAGHGLDGSEAGMMIVFDDPVSGSRGCSTVIRVDVTTAPPLAYVWTTQQAAELPAWVAGSPADVTIRVPSSQINEIHYEQRSIPGTSAYAPISDEVWPVSWLFNLRANVVRLRGGRVGMAGCYIRSAGETWGAISAECDEQFLGGFWRYPLGGTKYLYLLDTIAQEYGLTAGPTPITNALLGSAAASCSSETSGAMAFYGYLSGNAGGGQGRMSVERSSVGGVNGHYGGLTSVQSCMLRGSISADQRGEVYGRDLSWLDLPAAGLDSFVKASEKGLVRFQDADLEGNNTGSGADRKVAYATTDGEIVFEAGMPAGLKAKHRQLVAEGGRIVSVGAVAIGSVEGGGPDMEAVGVGSEIDLRDNFAKTATNPSGGGVAERVIKWSRGGRISQVAGKTFTLPAGSGNNTTDYGATGAIDGADSEAVLGTLTGMGAGTTNPACTLAYGANLRHGGAGPSGTAPLKFHGAAAAQAWPAASLSDAAAAVPEGCWVHPNAA